MMCSKATMKLMVILPLLPCILSGLNLMCPDVAEVNTAATLRCSFHGQATIYYDSPASQDVAKCFQKLHLPCDSTTNRYKIARVNTNTTNLEITTVQISDEGNWTCRNPNTLETSTCPLVLRRTPSCNISSSTEKSQQIVDDVEITLSVNITNYYCSVYAIFILQVGNTRHKLKKVDSGIYNITFNVTTSHFGSLELLFICNNATRNVTCGDVTSLRQHTSTSTPLPDQNTSASTSLPGIEYETRSCLLLGVGTGVAETLLLVGLCHLVIYLMRRKNTLCLSGNHYDEFQGRNVDPRTGYDDIGIPRSQEADTAEGGEYEMTGNQYYNLQGGNDDETAGYVEVDDPRSRDNVNSEGAEDEASEPQG